MPNTTKRPDGTPQGRRPRDQRDRPASEKPRSKRRARRPLGAQTLGQLLIVAALALLAAAGAQFLALTLWPADMIALGRNYVVLVGLVVFGATFVTRNWLTISVAALALAANFFLFVSPLMNAAKAAPASAGAASLTVATYNVAWDDAAFDAFAEWARTKDAPEIVTLVEVSDSWRTRMPELVDAYPYRASRLIEGDIRQEILSRSPIRDATVFRPSAGRSAVAAEIETLMGPVQVFALNPDKPQNAADWRARNGYLILAGQWVAGRSRGRSAIAAGSWYVTPWSPTYGDVLQASGLLNADRGILPTATRGLAGPSSGPIFGIPIDHVAVTSDIRSAGCSVGPSLGSDYLPLVCRLRLR